MRLVKDSNPGAHAVTVSCRGPRHETRWPGSLPRFTLAEGYADLDGVPFLDYYCNACVVKEGWQGFVIESPNRRGP